MRLQPHTRLLSFQNSNDILGGNIISFCSPTLTIKNTRKSEFLLNFRSASCTVASIVSPTMAETLSPNPKQRLLSSVVPRLQSPTSPFFLGSNDDQLERAQARAARAAKVRRKSIAPPRLCDGDPEVDPCLGKQQILDLFRNCIKLASENVRTIILSLSKTLYVFKLEL